MIKSLNSIQLIRQLFFRKYIVYFYAVYHIEANLGKVWIFLIIHDMDQKCLEETSSTGSFPAPSRVRIDIYIVFVFTLELSVQ